VFLFTIPGCRCLRIVIEPSRRFLLISRNAGKDWLQLHLDGAGIGLSAPACLEVSSLTRALFASFACWRRGAYARSPPTLPSFLLDHLQTVYLASSPLLLVFTSILHPSLTIAGHLPASMEFLPLMLTSVWCSLGMWLAWARLGMGMWGSGGSSGVEVKIE
jgi:hypothetical protein